MNKTLIGEVVDVDNSFKVKIDKNKLPDTFAVDTFDAINETEVLMFQGDMVKGELVYVSKKYNKYMFFIHKQHEGNAVDIDNFIDIIGLIVVSKINTQRELFGKMFKAINAKDLKTKKRDKVSSLARHISTYFAVKYLSSQASYDVLAPYFNRDRCSLYYIMDTAIPNWIDTDRQVRNIIEDLDESINNIYNNLKKK